jgi:cell division protein FtsQ
MTEQHKPRLPGLRAESSAPRRRKNRRARLREHTLELVRTGRLPAFVLSAGLAVLLGVFAMSDDFLVDNVVIRGNSIAYADAVVEQSGALGQPVFQLDTHEVAESVARHPVVDSARVSIELPDRVVVNVMEREPAIVWQTGDRAVLIDEHGWVLAEGESDDLPWVVELDGSLPAPGSHVDPGKIAAARYLSDQVGDSGILEYSEGDGFQVYIGDEQVVLFGSPDELPVKMKVVSALSASSADWSWLDVRDPERPVYQ